MEKTLRGIGVSPGIAIAPALVYEVGRFEVPEYRIADTEGEWLRLERAMDTARDELVELHRRTAQALGEVHAGIFNAHLMLLDDAAVLEEVKAELESKRLNIECLLARVARSFQQQMEGIGEARFRERAADLVDVTDRVLRHLLETNHPDLGEIKTPCVVVAHDLSPSDTASMNASSTVGLAVDSGNVTSHTAILARALEIPAVMGLLDASNHIQPGTVMVVDGSLGVVIVEPSEETLERYTVARKAYGDEQARLRDTLGTTPGKTRDGVPIETQANIELPIELAHSRKAGAHGVGLYRTEYLFLNRGTVPSEDEQFEAYADAARALNPFPVTLRTMDIGGDKFVGHLNILKEDNPQLGWRAVRFCLERPDIFKAQLRAMLRATVHGNVQIMFPMISGVQQMRDVKAVLAEVMDELKQAGIPFDDKVPVGSMIEVPSAVMLTDLLAKECDFFSIGTNDLIQYSLAVDRVNERIAHLYEPAHPAVLRMIDITARAAADAGIPCKLCGEMAGDPFFTEILLGLGVISFSMSTVSLPAVRAAIARVDLGEARALAREVLGLATSTEVRQLLRKRAGSRRSGKMEANGAANGV